MESAGYGFFVFWAQVLCLQIHGDAAFSAQVSNFTNGLCAHESFDVIGYRHGNTINGKPSTLFSGWQCSFGCQ